MPALQSLCKAVGKAKSGQQQSSCRVCIDGNDTPNSLIVVKDCAFRSPKLNRAHFGTDRERPIILNFDNTIYNQLCWLAA
jgi:hypothetical protein